MPTPADYRFPTTIRLGPRTYRIRRTTPVMLTPDSRAVGTFCAKDLVIEVDSALSPPLQWETLVHELLHLALEYTNLSDELGDKREEAVVARLTPVLTAAVLEVMRQAVKPTAASTTRRR